MKATTLDLFQDALDVAPTPILKGELDMFADLAPAAPVMRVEREPAAERIAKLLMEWRTGPHPASWAGDRKRDLRRLLIAVAACTVPSVTVNDLRHPTWGRTVAAVAAAIGIHGEPSDMHNQVLDVLSPLVRY